MASLRENLLHLNAKLIDCVVDLEAVITEGLLVIRGTNFT